MSKRFAKFLVYLISTLITLPIAILYKSTNALIKGDHLFMSIGQSLLLFPGKFGSYIRVAFYHQVLPSFSKNVYIGFGTYFSHPDVEVGEGVYIGSYCIIGKVKIRNHVTIGSNVNILSGKKQNNFEELGKPIQEQGGFFESVEIGENCWIGNGAIIMANLGKQCIIGAGSVIAKETSDYEILAGNPAKLIRRLNEKKQS